MYKLEDFLVVAEKHEASDIHLSTGEHPRLRVKGKLHSLGGEGVLLAEENIMKIMESTLHENQKERCRKLFQENGSVDYSYEVSLDTGLSFHGSIVHCHEEDSL
ncbi:MAG: hypothetical protein ACYSPJ_10235 [Planctomycetota bacterium]|jgi:Tfp pilus assembly pilus retraction ATPase PilT